MARSIRIEFEGAFYHVMARGNRKEAIFFNDDDRRFFLTTLADARERTGWKIHAWVLMNNHYHLLVETPHANLVEGMKWLQNAYTRRINTKHQLWGRIFGDRYKSVLVEGEDPNYFTTLLDYIHLNPARAGLVNFAEGGRLIDYTWSSLAMSYALEPAERPEWCCVETGLGAFGETDTPEGRQAFVERLEKRAVEEAGEAGIVPVPAGADARGSHLRRGWYWGSEAFARKALEQAKTLLESRKNPTYRVAQMNHSHDEQAARELVAEGLRMHNLSEEDLAALPGSDPRKVAIARVVRGKTSVRLGWIADALKMKSAANVSQQLRRAATQPVG
jgi:putative transposase